MSKPFVKLPFRPFILVIAAILFAACVFLGELDALEGKWWGDIIKTVSSIGLSAVSGVFVAALFWATDISDTFNRTIDSTATAIVEKIAPITDALNYTADITNFPYSNLSVDQLMDLSKACTEEYLKRTVGANKVSDVHKDLLNSLYIYHEDIMRNVTSGIFFRTVTRDIKIEPNSQEGHLSIMMTLHYSLYVPAGCESQFSHLPCFRTFEEANSLTYHRLRINNKDLKEDPDYQLTLKVITERDPTHVNFRYQRGWIHKITDAGQHDLNTQYSFHHTYQTYLHTFKLIYPCAFMNITCEVVGPEKNEWVACLEPFSTKWHLHDKHMQDLEKKTYSGERIGASLSTKNDKICLLDGSGYALVVHKK